MNDFYKINEKVDTHFIINKKGYGKENWELQKRIDKAIDYINEELIPYGDEWHWDNATIGDMVNELLDILKGRK